MYSENRLKVVSFKKVNPGAKICYHYRITSKTSSVLPFSGTHVFRGRSPIKKKSFSLFLPDTMNINFNIEPDQKSKEENEICYTWERKNLLRIKDYEYRPPYSYIAEELIFSSANSWQEMGVSVYDILSKEIKPLKRTKEIDKLYLFVKDSIRIIPISLPLTGSGIFSPKEIMKNKYGAPRDKNTLFISLLQGAQHEAFPAFICIGSLSEETLYKTLPTLSPFFRLATAVNIGDSILFLDPSCKYCPSNYVDFEGKTAWIIKKDTSYFYKVPKSNNNKISVDSRYEISTEGNLKAKITAEITGCFFESFQYWLDSEKEDTKKKFLEYILSEISVSAKADTINIDITKNKVQINLTFESPRYAPKQGKYITMKLINNIVPFFPLSSLVNSEDRLYPYYFDFSNAKVEEKTIVVYPKTLNLEHLPENMELSGDGYFFKIESSSKDGQIRIIRKASYAKRIISEKTNVAADIKKFLDENTLGVLFVEK